MKETTKVQVSDEIKKILSGSKNYQNQLAEKMGISASHLINMKEPSKWDLVSDRYWQKAASFFSISPGWTIHKLANFQIVEEVCNASKLESGFYAIHGKSGLGKTTALKHYARTNRNAFYVLVDYLQKSKEFFISIAEALGSDTTGSARVILQGIVDKLNELDSPVLIIDDAGKLNDNNFRNIQLIHDSTEGNAGIVIAGTNYLKTYVSKMVQKGKMGFDELSRRVNHWQALSEPTFTEIKSICTANGITDSDTVNYLFNKVKDFGTLKNVLIALKRAARGRPITIEFVMKTKLL